MEQCSHLYFRDGYCRTCEWECPHDSLVFTSYTCALCTKDVLDLSDYSDIQLHDTVKITVKHHLAKKIEDENIQRLKKSVKLSLVLDLDNTLLHSTSNYELKKSKPTSQWTEVYDFTLNRVPFSGKQLTKLRPGLAQFLEEASKLFEIHIFTQGTQEYANAVTSIIDPQHKYFMNVFSYNNCVLNASGDLMTKNLKVLFPYDDSMVVIVDDRVDVWESFYISVIKVFKYVFFSTQENQVTQESNTEDNHLAHIIKVLKHIHTEFYYNDTVTSVPKDVKLIIENHRKQVLSNAHIAFSQVFHSHSNQERQPLWINATAFGAKCYKEFNSNITHLVSRTSKTHKAKEAARSGVHIVTESWLEDSILRWEKMPEEDYKLVHTNQ